MFCIDIDEEISFLDAGSGLQVVYEASVEFGQDRKQASEMRKRAKKYYKHAEKMYNFFVDFHCRDDKGRREIITDATEILNSPIDCDWIKDLARKAIDKANGIKEPKIRNCKSRFQKPGFVYLINSEGDKYKIGVTTNICSRTTHLGTVIPYEVKLIHSFYTKCSYEKEKELHDKYSEFRIAGEWFLLSPEQVQEFCSITGDHND
jgi:hypothetical protein